MIIGGFPNEERVCSDCQYYKGKTEGCCVPIDMLSTIALIRPKCWLKNITTNRDYIKSLRGDLFDATLLGLMGLDMGSHDENELLNWLNSPIDDGFLTKTLSPDKLNELYGRLKEICEFGESKQQINSEDK